MLNIEIPVADLLQKLSIAELLVTVTNAISQKTWDKTISDSKYCYIVIQDMFKHIIRGHVCKETDLVTYGDKNEYRRSRLHFVDGSQIDINFKMRESCNKEQIPEVIYMGAYSMKPTVLLSYKDE